MKKLIVFVLILSAIVCISGTGSEKGYKIVPATYDIVHLRIDYGDSFRPEFCSTVIENDTLVLDLTDVKSLIPSLYATTHSYYPEALNRSVEYAFSSLYPDDPDAIVYAENLINNLVTYPYIRKETVILDDGKKVTISYYKLTGLFYEADKSYYYPYCINCLGEHWKDKIGIYKTVIPVAVMYMDSVGNFIIQSKR